MNALGETAMDGAIYRAAARWDDETAMTALLAPLPESIVANIREGRAAAAGGSFSGMRHDAFTNRAFHVRGDATAVEVWTLSPCSVREAAATWAGLNAEGAGTRPKLDVATIARAYTKATGGRVEFVQ